MVVEAAVALYRDAQECQAQFRARIQHTPTEVLERYERILAPHSNIDRICYFFDNVRLARRTVALDELRERSLENRIK